MCWLWRTVTRIEAFLVCHRPIKANLSYSTCSEAKMLLIVTTNDALNIKLEPSDLNLAVQSTGHALCVWADHCRVVNCPNCPHESLGWPRVSTLCKTNWTDEHLGEKTATHALPDKYPVKSRTASWSGLLWSCCWWYLLLLLSVSRCS